MLCYEGAASYNPGQVSAALRPLLGPLDPLNISRLAGPLHLQVSLLHQYTLHTSHRRRMIMWT